MPRRAACMTGAVRPDTLYRRAGPLGRATAMANLALLVLLPLSWTLPLLKNSAFWVLSSEVTILWGALELARTEPFLALIVALFAMAVPFAKTLLYVYLWFFTDGRRTGLSQLGSTLAKLSMTDVFLVAIAILAVKGLGIGKIEPQYGLYVFTGVVLAAIAVSLLTERLSRG